MSEDDDEERTGFLQIDPSAFARPQEGKNAYLIIVGGKLGAGRMFRLERDSAIIGRAEDADIVLADEGVSRKHVRVVLLPDGSVELTDLGSTNGTYYQGERIARTVLNDGDKFQVGSTAILKFSLQDALDEELQKNLYESATRDALTGLYNKKFFLDALEKEFSYSHRHLSPLTLLILDVDHFKHVNDTYGHLAGDHVLQRLGRLLPMVLRSEDLVARYGGEEIVVLMRETPLSEGARIAERLRASIEGSEFAFQGTHIPITASIGVAALEQGFPTAAHLVEAADQMLYQAKESGRNRIMVRPLAD